MAPRSRALIAAVLLALAAAGAPPASAQSDQRCFPETGQCIGGRIRQFWEKNGGLPVFGFPIGPQQEEQIEGRPFQVQRFERNRLELHPENKAPYDVLLGRLGADRLAQLGKDWQAYPKSGAQAGCRFFPETGHNVCGAILKAWRASGLEIDGKKGKTEAENLALFGLPLSDIVTETMADGQQRQVQWFERARFEIHPENQPPYDVLLGLLGNEIRDGGAAATPPAASPPPSGAPSCGAAQPPAGGAINAGCFRGGDRINVLATGLRPGEQVDYALTSPDGAARELAVIIGDGLVTPDGAYSLSGAVAPGSPAGRYTLTLRGHKSGASLAFPFDIIAGPPSDGRDWSAIPAPVGKISVSPQVGHRAQEYFTFTTRGIDKHQRIGVYVTRPDGAVYGAPFYVEADDDGNVPAGLHFSTSKDDPIGIYAATFEIITTGEKLIVYFRVIPEA